MGKRVTVCFKGSFFFGWPNELISVTGICKHLEVLLANIDNQGGSVVKMRNNLYYVLSSQNGSIKDCRSRSAVLLECILILLSVRP